ncbi:hypothetical protein BC628DRAFT_1424916 [Trametes gibbosa]|nr:hypothetical protein BC628DRAFT_1424916 [Trametes gibbosa]
MWAADVGDYSVEPSVVGPNRKARSQRLCEMHTFQDPKVYVRASLAHPVSERPLFDWEECIISWMNVTDAIGNFANKLHGSYLDRLFRYMSGYDPLSRDVREAIPNILTPPYIISESSVRLTDLKPVWDFNNKTFRFTDGVDLLVDGELAFKL